MLTFMLSLNWTDQGIRAVKDAPKRAQAARDLAKKVGVEIKQVYLTSGDSDIVIFLDTSSGDNIAKFALALGALGNVRPHRPGMAGGGIPQDGLRVALNRIAATAAV